MSVPRPARVGKALLELQHHGPDALGDLCRVVGSRVVGADHQHHGPRAETLTLPVLQTIEHALRGIAGNAEVGNPITRKS